MDYVVEKLVWMLLRGSVKSIYIWLEVLIGCKWKNGEKHSHLVCLSEQHWWEPGVMVFAKGWNINLVWRFIPTFNLLLNMQKNIFCQIYLDQPKILKAIWNFYWCISGILQMLYLRDATKFYLKSWPGVFRMIKNKWIQFRLHLIIKIYTRETFNDMFQQVDCCPVISFSYPGNNFVRKHKWCTTQVARVKWFLFIWPKRGSYTKQIATSAPFD